MSSSPDILQTNPEKLAQVTYFWDRLRGISAGINEAVMGTFVLLVAIRVFDASSAAKSVITGSLWMGMILTPVFLWGASWLRLHCNRACVIYTLITALCFTVSMFSTTVEQYILSVSLSMIFGVQGFTLLPRILAENYSPEIRGKRVATTYMIAGVVFMISSQIFGILLDKDLGNYFWILGSAAAAYFWVAFVYFHIPSPRLEKPVSRFPYHTVRLFWRNPAFGKLALLWSLIEFGNFMIIPMRMEYVANDRYGIDLSNTQITWLIAVTPLVFALLTSRTWGRLFDLFRVESIQAAMGFFLILSVILYFLTTNFWWMLLAMSFFGISLGAQKILNQLWITKVVEKEKVADYISAFAILSGIRGVLAPILWSWLLKSTSPTAVGYGAAGIICLGSVGLLMLWRSVARN